MYVFFNESAPTATEQAHLLKMFLYKAAINANFVFHPDSAFEANSYSLENGTHHLLGSIDSCPSGCVICLLSVVLNGQSDRGSNDRFHLFNSFPSVEESGETRFIEI
ncbi:hypothetical protein GEMRC1_009871 [Eukaryota sp. GEM-RC1]